MRDLAEQLEVLFEARPIKIDKSEAKKIAGKLATALKTHLQKVSRKDGNLGEVKKPIGPVLTTDIVDVMGRKQRINVAMVAKLAPGHKWIAGGGIGVHKGSGRLKDQPIIMIVLNGNQSVESFLSVVDSILKKNFYEMLIHELTHAADTANPQWRVPEQKKRGFQPPGRREYSRYFNDPSEVRAYMQEVTDQVAEFVSKNKARLLRIADPNKIIRWALNFSETWQDIKDELNAKNRNLILKAVYTVLQDAGLLR